MFGKPQTVIDVYGAADHAKIPMGHFICETDKTRTLGRNSLCGLFWAVRRPADMTDKMLEQLPLVRLHATYSAQAVVRVGDFSCVDTSALDGFDWQFEFGN